MFIDEAPVGFWLLPPPPLLWTFTVVKELNSHNTIRKSAGQKNEAFFVLNSVTDIGETGMNRFISYPHY